MKTITKEELIAKKEKDHILILIKIQSIEIVFQMILKSKGKFNKQISLKF
jgi:hypothetical protein